MPLDCDDGNSCTKDCDPAVGCVHRPLPDGSSCNDHDTCTLGDTRVAGTCVGGSLRKCDDLDACTADSCDAVAGCQHATMPDGTSCGTGMTCTFGVCS